MGLSLPDILALPHADKHIYKYLPLSLFHTHTNLRHMHNTRTYIHDTEVHWNQEMRDGEGAEKGDTVTDRNSDKRETKV